MAFDVSTIPLSIYIHIPWCIQKCPYCDFNSYAIDKHPNQEDVYIDCLMKDFENDFSHIQDRRIQSIFFGGGTPSLLSPQNIERVLAAIAKRVNFSDSIEITLEANPGTFEIEKFKDFVKAGINRFSLGIQSFDDAQLKTLGRVHSNIEAKRAIASMHDLAIKSFNIDLMYALPNQSIKSGLCDIETALSFEPPHLSWYHLTLEPNTVFYRQPPKGLPDNDVVIALEQQAYSLFAAAGLQRYEVSAFAQAHHASLHNLNYWQFGDYLGIGAGAHGKITSHSGEIIRTTKWKTPRQYLERLLQGYAPRNDAQTSNPFVSNVKTVATDELPLEFFMNALRLVDGVPENYWVQRTGLSRESLQTKLAPLVTRGLIEVHDGSIRATHEGYAFLDEVLTQV